MLICDLCKKEREMVVNEISKRSIHIEYVSSAWQPFEIDMCDNCRRELREKINQAEADFYQSKLKGGAE